LEGVLYTSLWWRKPAEQRIRRSLTFKDNFLPQAGLTYKFSDTVEVFTSYAENLAAPNNGVTASDTFDQGLTPERSENVDVGLRYSGRSFGASFSIFLNKYKSRILSIPLTQEELVARGLSGVTGAAIFKNVGGIDSQGAEASFDWRTPIKGFRLSGSFALQESTFTDNVPVSYSAFHDDPSDPRSKFFVPVINADGSKTISLEQDKGKDQGNTPFLTVNFDANYKWSQFDFGFGGQFYDKVFVNTLNTEELPSYTVYNASVTYRGRKGTRLEPFALTISAQNVFDQEFFTARTSTGAFNGSVGADYGRNLVATIEFRF
jgi:iron complex outermembrane receptor protein